VFFKFWNDSVISLTLLHIPSFPIHQTNAETHRHLKSRDQTDDEYLTVSPKQELVAYHTTFYYNVYAIFNSLSLINFPIKSAKSSGDVTGHSCTRPRCRRGASSSGRVARARLSAELV